ncbi:hypothetical protein ILUMI_20239 [Ignelater luminosus]|uniref:Uncharacterized protein n=1 Tax=Ignelater luminosus TaxID=2038154 RepID=A0A8K0CIK6_IGNLU|nr:hypothetical protein ILUMI_20239 [Ignelater luminosus]
MSVNDLGLDLIRAQVVGIQIKKWQYNCLRRVLKVYEIHQHIRSLLTVLKAKWETRLHVNGDRIGPVNISRETLQRDSLTLPWFILALNTLSSVLNQKSYEYRLDLQENENALRWFGYLMRKDLGRLTREYGRWENQKIFSQDETRLERGSNTNKRQDDSKLNECVKWAFNEIRPHVSNGIEEIGLPPLNPLVIPKLKIRQDTPMANYTLTMVNFTITGLDKYDLKEFQYDPKANTFHFRIQFDPLPLAAFYKISGQVVRIPLEGKGIGRAAIGPINAIFEIKGGMRKSRGIDYYDPKYVNITLDMGDGSYYMSGLFNNEQLERIANNMVNANSLMVVEAMTPMFEKLGEIGTMRFMKTLTKIPFSRLLPSSQQ